MAGGTAGVYGLYELGKSFQSDGGGSGSTLNDLTHQSGSNKREAMRKSIIEDQSLDEFSRQELLALFPEGDDNKMNTTIASEYALAKAGEGKYAGYRKNYELAKQLSDQPGRRQTILTQGAKELTGTESSGLLTGVPTDV